MTIHGPDRAEAGHRLAEHPLVPVQALVAGRHVVDAGVAEGVAHRLRGRDPERCCSDDDAELDLGIDVVGDVAVPGERGAVAGDRGSRLAVDERALGARRRARAVVVEADRIDRAGIRDGWAERDRVQRPAGLGGLRIQPRPESIEGRMTAGSDGSDAGEPGRPRVDRDDPVVVAHHGRPRPPLDEDGGQAHGVRPGPSGRRGAAPRPCA